MELAWRGCALPCSAHLCPCFYYLLALSPLLWLCCSTLLRSIMGSWRGSSRSSCMHLMNLCRLLPAPRHHMTIKMHCCLNLQQLPYISVLSSSLCLYVLFDMYVRTSMYGSLWFIDIRPLVTIYFLLHVCLGIVEWAVYGCKNNGICCIFLQVSPEISLPHLVCVNMKDITVSFWYQPLVIFVPLSRECR